MIDSPIDVSCTSDADCPGNGYYHYYCGEVVPGGYRTCLRDVVIQTTCSPDPSRDACGCNGRTCPSGSSCVRYESNISTCGTGGSGGANICSTGCTPGACPSGQACLRGLVPTIGACYPSTCRTDQDCGGCSRCVPYWTNLSGCGNSLQGLRCTCRTDSDCKPGLVCQTYDGTTGFCI